MLRIGSAVCSSLGLLAYGLFPPPGIAAFSLPDTISAPVRSQRLPSSQTVRPPAGSDRLHTSTGNSRPVRLISLYRSRAGKVPAESGPYG